MTKQYVYNVLLTLRLVTQHLARRQSGFKLNRTNLNRSQSIYMWTRSKNSYIIEVSLLSLESEQSCICVLGISSQESERSCICMLGVSSQESERSCICVLGVSSQESERSCICVLGVSSQESEWSCICVFVISYLFLRFDVWFRNCSDSVVVFVFHFNIPPSFYLLTNERVILSV